MAKSSCTLSTNTLEGPGLPPAVQLLMESMPQTVFGFEITVRDFRSRLGKLVSARRENLWSDQVAIYKTSLGSVDI